MQCYTPAYHPVTVLPLWIIFWTYTYKIQTYSKIIVQVLNKKAYLYGVFYSATAAGTFTCMGICLILVPLLIDDR